MDEFNPRKLFRDIDRRVLLVVASGILLSLLFFTLALAKRPGVQSDQTDSPTLNISKNLGFTVLKGSPGSNSSAPISAPVIVGQNCTNTVRYWLEKPGDWPTDNLVVGQFTFRIESILAIFQAEDQDEVTRVQQQFLAAALNILQGADTGKIEAVMVESSAWLNDHPAKIELTEQEKGRGAEFADRLASFNRGLTGPGACPGNPPESTSTALSNPILLPDGPVLGYSSGSVQVDVQPDQGKKKPLLRRESQPEPSSPAAPAADFSQPIPTIPPTSPPTTTEDASTPQVASPAPVVSDPGISQIPSQPAYNPPSQGPSTPQEESKKPKEKKNPKRPPHERAPGPPAPSQPAGQPTPQTQVGSGDPPGPSSPGNPGNDPGNGSGNGNGGGNGNGHGNGGGNGKGHGKKP